jgi:hypothetical protein
VFDQSGVLREVLGHDDYLGLPPSGLKTSVS